MTATVDAPALPPPAAAPTALAARRARLVLPMPADRWRGWLVTALITALAAVPRFWRLGVPKVDVFDEIYYHWEAIGLLRYGVEQEKKVILGTVAAGPDFVVHPPLGKWMIAAGIQLFGNTPFGWRFSSAVAGTLAVLLMVRLARRMFRSTLLGGLAGLLFSLDGMELVQSRVAMLDIFYLTVEVAAFACLVVDRDDGRSRLAARLAAGEADPLGPRLGIRWWRIATGFSLGCLAAVKWDAVYLLPAYAALA
ncbi:MAG: phospholipid carrier-dependent glycosyltransferase, partial [Mycobacteriales bacterium]